MCRKKIVYAMLGLILVSLLATSVSSYAIEISDNCRRAATEPGATDPATGKTAGNQVDDAIPPGGRGADISFVTAEQHQAINLFLAASNARTNRRNIISDGQGEYGEKIIVKAIDNLRNPAENRPANGHYSIRGEYDANGNNTVYVYVDSKKSNNTKLSDHEIAEYKSLIRGAQVKFNSDGSLSLRQVKEKLVAFLDNPANAEEAAKMIDNADRAAISEVGEIEPGTVELVQDTSTAVLAGRRGANVPGTGDIARNIMFDITQESYNAINGPSETVTTEVAQIFNQVFAIDGSKIEGKEKGFKDYLANKATNEAVVAVFKSQEDLKRIADGFLAETGLNLIDVVHLRILGQGDLAKIREEQLRGMFDSNLANGDFSEVKIGSALENYKTVAVAIGKGV